MYMDNREIGIVDYNEKRVGAPLELSRTTVAMAPSRRLDIMKADIRYDSSIQQLLSEKIILAWILKKSVEEYKDIEIYEIATKYIEGEAVVSKTIIYPDEIYREQEMDLINDLGVREETIDEGIVHYDIRFNAIIPVVEERVALIVNVEAQTDFYPLYPSGMRGIYHGSGMLSSQYGRGLEQSCGEQIKQVYAIWVCANISKHGSNSIASYNITERKSLGIRCDEALHYDLLTTMMIYFGNVNTTEHDLLRLLDSLLVSDLENEENKILLEDEYRREMIRSMEGEAVWRMGM